ncbi:MAG: SCP2 sterol-binding domain-containing protein [Robiginitomaculum sp.]
MTNEEIITKMKKAIEKAGGLDKSVKFDFGDDGVIHASGTEVSGDDNDADCTISISKDDFVGLSDGNLDPMTAFMSGKLKVAGDMSVAMGLQSFFSSM